MAQRWTTVLWLLFMVSRCEANGTGRLTHNDSDGLGARVVWILTRLTFTARGSTLVVKI